MTKKNKRPKIKYDRDYKFEDRVNRVFDILRKTNVCTRDNLIKYSYFMNKNISENRFNVLVKLKYIKKIPVVDKRTKEEYEAYQLTDRGRLYCKDYLDGSLYASTSTFHDYHQSNYLFENFNIQEIETYKHEKELIAPSETDVHISIQQTMSRPDGKITVNGEDVFIETITKDYSPAKVKAKITYVEYHCAKCLYNVL